MNSSEDFKSFFSDIRISLETNIPITKEYDSLFNFDKSISQIYITLFQENNNSIRWGSRRDTLSKTINRVVEKLKQNNDFSNFSINNTKKCRILFEIITKEYACNIRNLTTLKMDSPNRFEPGVNGLIYQYKGITRFFMPTDGYTKSIMSVRQLLNYLSKQCGVSKLTDKISERVHLMRREPIVYTFIESLAYVSFNNEVLKLERGYPIPIDFNKEMLYDKTIKSIDWLIKNMNNDGSFLYYYDPYKDTIVDDMHPEMLDPLYNNILRHSGGTITLLRGYELNGNKLYLKKAKKSIDFLLSTFRTHKYKKEFACYPFFNKKSKLGGAGIGLVAIMHYYIKTGDESYRKEMDGLVRHILSRVDKDGELIGYYIHPKFNNGKAITNPSDNIKKELFSFYYPGEALLGLALYYLHTKDIEKNLKEDIKIKSKMALDFLVDVRPIKYDYLFDSLPADAWLMQAIEEWIKVDGFKKQNYIDFVFNDTKTMLEHMYTEENTLQTNKDYIGGFYYDYGDHVYHDASRCEGIVSAYYLAKYIKDEEKAKWIMNNMLLSAKGLMKTFNSEESTYSHPNNKALHSFRFKLTRQWVRVDSVQHAACFLSRLYKTL
ncbi:protein containing Six-hairpin glycosidase-like domain protein [Sulfurimonas sp.]|uniref:protein containing Six-hairpin glycosidase-like domain protein n=1 Tax=Sulfurimonas sp. TaxID=2022749 RepID=UPI0035680C42